MRYVWVGLGDADTYNHFDDLAEAAEYMTLFGVRHVYRSRKYGVATNGLTGQNDISLFFGDAAAEPTGELSDKDVRFVNDCLLIEERP